MHIHMYAWNNNKDDAKLHVRTLSPHIADACLSYTIMYVSDVPLRISLVPGGEMNDNAI